MEQGSELLLKGSCGGYGELKASTEWGCLPWDTQQKVSRVYLTEDDQLDGES